MTHGTSQQGQQPSPRAQAVQAAAQAVDAHVAAPDSVTFHHMQRTVQAAQDLGASLADIRNARGQR